MIVINLMLVNLRMDLADCIQWIDVCKRIQMKKGEYANRLLVLGCAFLIVQVQVERRPTVLVDTSFPYWHQHRGNV